MTVSVRRVEEPRQIVVVVDREDTIELRATGLAWLVCITAAETDLAAEFVEGGERGCVGERELSGLATICSFDGEHR